MNQLHPLNFIQIYSNWFRVYIWHIVIHIYIGIIGYLAVVQIMTGMIAHIFVLCWRIDDFFVDRNQSFLIIAGNCQQ